ncbi:MAG: peptide deformylase [Rickettsiales bacterium]
MAVLPLVLSPDNRLNVASAPVEGVDDAIRRLMDDMLDTMYASDGVGLAAVQVGVHQRVLVMDVRGSAARYPDAKKRDGAPEGPFFMANPEIVSASESLNVYDEGCLSFPGQSGKVTRPAAVAVRYLDYRGESQLLECDELLATCVQHEIDHLNGVTFVDRLSKLKRDMILKKMRKRADADARTAH